MKHLKNTVAAITLLAVIAFGTTFANAGIIVAGFNEKEETPCTETTRTEKMDWGIIVAGLRGIIVAGPSHHAGSPSTHPPLHPSTPPPLPPSTPPPLPPLHPSTAHPSH